MPSIALPAVPHLPVEAPPLAPVGVEAAADERSEPAPLPPSPRKRTVTKRKPGKKEPRRDNVIPFRRGCPTRFTRCFPAGRRNAKWPPFWVSASARAAHRGRLEDRPNGCWDKRPNGRFLETKWPVSSPAKAAKWPVPKRPKSGQVSADRPLPKIEETYPRASPPTRFGCPGRPDWHLWTVRKRPKWPLSMRPNGRFWPLPFGRFGRSCWPLPWPLFRRPIWPLSHPVSGMVEGLGRWPEFGLTITPETGVVTRPGVLWRDALRGCGGGQRLRAPTNISPRVPESARGGSRSGSKVSRARSPWSKDL